MPVFSHHDYEKTSGYTSGGVRRAVYGLVELHGRFETARHRVWQMDFGQIAKRHWPEPS